MKKYIIGLLLLTNILLGQTVKQIDSILFKYGSQDVLSQNFTKYSEMNKNAYEDSKALGYKKGIAISADHLAMVYLAQSDYVRTINYANEAYKIAREIKDSAVLASVIGNIASAYIETSDTVMARKYLNEGLNIALKTKDLKAAGDMMFFFSIIDEHSSNIECQKRSLKYLYKAIDYFNKSNPADSSKIAISQLQLGYNYFKFNMDSGMYYIHKANRLSHRINDNMVMGMSSMVLSDIVTYNKNYDSAKVILNDALNTIKKFKDYKMIGLILHKLSTLYSYQHDYKPAYQNLFEAYNLKDSILSQDQIKEITTLKLNLEFDKEKELLALNKFKEQAELNQKIEKEHIINYFLIGFAILLFIVIGVVYKSYRSKHKYNVLIEGQKKQMVDSINYAKGIQEAIMPDIHENNVFVLYKPKDIVSGDFYWTFEKNGNKYYAVADCTGHGVPGALLSMLCSQLLNEAIDSSLDPAIIINRVKVSLEQRMQAMGRNDGMEIGLVCVNGNDVYFAGIKRPLYLVHENKIEVIKPMDNDNVKIDTVPGMMMYMTTDGYSDQFGSNGKKFTSKQMKDKMLMVSNLNINHQLDFFDKTIIEWKGKTEQTDDILLMGIQF